MHAALKDILGEHIQQAGSLVCADYLRFDVTHFEKITSKELLKIEQYVNDKIRNNSKVGTEVKGYDEAKKCGATALFGEKYGDEVRVVQMGNYSHELCGGTHVDRTGDIGVFKIIEESSLASGVRRLMALTGKPAFDHMQKQNTKLNEIQRQLKCAQSEIITRIDKLIEDKKSLEKKIKKRNESSGNGVGTLLKSIITINEYNLLVTLTEAESMEDAKLFGDELSGKLKSGIAVLFFKGEKKPGAVVVVTSNLNKNSIKAGDLAKTIGGFMGGGGGGKPSLATAGGRDKNLVEEAMTQTVSFLKTLLMEIH